MKQDKIVSSVKDVDLVKKRRDQMIQASISLFKDKGFHRTTTREIAKQSGFSIGTLYEYIRTKEDILFLVCDEIYEQVQSRLEVALSLDKLAVDKLIHVVELYFYIMEEMQEEVLILYQEVKALKKESQHYVLQKEVAMVSMLKDVIKASAPSDMTTRDIDLIANNIFVQGQMWAFRRWALRSEFTLEEYISKQVSYLKRVLYLEENATI